MGSNSEKGQKMKVQKYEISRAIDRLKNVIDRNPSFPALDGILIKDRYFIGSNAELTVQIKSEACGPMDEFILPSRAFDLIRSLPDGEVEITSDKDNIVTVRTGRTRNRYQSFKPEDYTLYQPKMDFENGITISGEDLMSAFGNVVHAADKKSVKPVLQGVFVGKAEDGVDVVGSDGHMLAWDKVPHDSEGTIETIVPRTAVEKIISLGISDDVTINYNMTSIIFRSSEFMVSSRLIDGKYLDFKRFFGMDLPIRVEIDRKELTNAMNRAKLSMIDASGVKKPAVVTILEDTCEISIASALGDYKEDLSVQSNIPEPFVIGLNPVVVLDSIKAFGDGNISLKFINGKSPVFMEQEGSNFQTMVLPVAIDARQTQAAEKKGEANE